ncbi:glycosyltransferase family 61 protein [Rosistilla ulvae]|nr:glycosyltransferase 61 family protein [Rosistilla ulvae]
MDILKHNRKLIHRGKYVFAPTGLLPVRRGAKKPQRLDASRDLLAEYPDRMRLLWHDPAEGGSVIEIAGGWCYGRRCDWIGIDDRALADLHGDGSQLIPEMPPSGPLNPRYYRHRLTTSRRFPKPVQVDGDVVILNSPGSHNYYHWLRETLPRLELVRQAGIMQADAYVIDNYKSFQWQALQLLGIPAEKIIEPHQGLMLQANRLIVPSIATAGSRRRLGIRLQSQTDNTLAALDSKPSQRVYVSRRIAKKRSLGNDAEVAGMLAKHGFESHCLEEYNLEAQIRLFRDASIVVGMHGAGLVNILLTRRPLNLIEIRPESCHRDCFELLANELGVSYRRVTAGRGWWRAPWQCPLERLETAVVHAIATSESQASLRRTG